MELNPQIGGRITSLKIDGQDFLTDSSINSFNWGSTFWLSPQANWNWPPSAAIDNLPYDFNNENGTIKMVSGMDSATGLVVEKEFSKVDRDTSFKLVYTIINKSEEMQEAAPWEVTRVKIGGLAFFPVGDGQITGGLAHLMVHQNGISWYQYNKDSLPKKGDRQFYADGDEGWVAYAQGGYILIKKFQDIPIGKIAPKEGEVELFVSQLNQDTGYVEVENQGIYEKIAPRGSLRWTIKWFLRKIPASIRLEAGNPDLVRFVRRIVE